MIWVKRAALALAVLLVVSQFIRPAKTNPPINPQREIGAKLPVDPAVASIFERSCNDCHSNRTVWPWYSNIAPVSWLLVRDVKEGRGEMNFSDWDALPPQRQQRRLQQICTEVREGEMPGLAYELMHPKAKLSAGDKDLLCNWSKAAQESLPRPASGS